jgi:PPIC-type PPIASE domain
VKRASVRAMFKAKQLLTTFSTVALCLGIAACGGASKSGSTGTTTHNSANAATQAATTSSVPPAAPPQKVIAQVGSQQITWATVSRLMTLASAPEAVPDPPSYTSCVAAMKSGEEGAQKSEGELKQSCSRRYRTLLDSAVSKAIHSRWLIGEADELGIRISPAAVREEFDASKKSFKTAAEFEAYRKSTGQSVAEMMEEIKLGKVADAIFKLVASKEHAASAAEVASYYRSHSAQFGTPAGREVRIFRTTSKAAAVKAAGEVKAGKSFAEVAKALSAVGQPLGAKDGVVKDLLPGAYEEKALNDPIFSAKLHKLYGPLEISGGHKTIAPETNSGFFVFEVVGLVPGKQAPLAAVKASIAQSLTKAQKEKTLAGFIAAFRKKWTSRSSCEAAYVVRNCKQYKGAEAGGSDPFTL